MRALVLHEFGRLKLIDLPDPVAADGEVVVRVVATGICGSDLHGYTGGNGRRSPGQVMGHELVGVVESNGPGAAATVGALVTVNPVMVPAQDADAYRGREQHHPRKRVLGVDPTVVAGFAERIVVPERNVVELLAGTAVATGALVEPLAVAVHAVRRAGVAPGDGVLVLGGGPIGQAIVLALRMAGVDRVVVSEVSAARRALLTALGAVAVDPVVEAVPTAVARILGAPADVAIDAVGISATLADALASTRLDATVCLVGMGAKRLELDAFAVSTAERSIVGSFTYGSDDFVEAAAWLAGEPALAASLVSEVVTMAAADDAFQRLVSGEDLAGKILISLDEDRLPVPPG